MPANPFRSVPPGVTSERSSSRLGPLSLFLTYAVGLWMVLVHQLEGGHERGEPTLFVHFLRDSTLALPAVLLAVYAGARLSERLLRRAAGATRTLELTFTAALLAVATSAVFALGGPVHEQLFAAREEHELPLAVHLARDFLLGLFVALPLAGAALARPRALRFDRRFARVVLVGAAMAGLASVAGSAAGAAAAPGEPCPAGAPLKRFDVQAIDIDIPLNRFGDHDPAGKMYVLSNRVADVRAQAASRKVSTGLRDDPLQALVIRANQGDCVEISFTNNASGGAFGMHIDGLSFDVGSSGDAVGQNASSAVPQGGNITYRYFVPDQPGLEGAHYIRPGPAFRSAVNHGLFGVLAVEPPGSRYLNVTTGDPIESGWEASIVPGNGRPSFREFVQIYHEIGNENDNVFNSRGDGLPRVDPLTGSYRPAARAINYRSEPFGNRMNANPREEALGYASYTFGDPPTPSMRGYLGDPTKIRLVHGGTEMFHVFHLHGGGIRWRFNPLADHTYDYADTGLNKHPKTQLSPSQRLDSQSFGPGETYNLEIEGGAGGVQQAAGDFLYHCHIASHYVSGMWAFWRVFDTLQPDLAPLPDRAALPKAVDSAGLIGRTMPNGTVVTQANVDDWIRPQLPPQGVRKSDEDASVWNWAIDSSNPAGSIYLGEPEDKRPNPDLPNLDSSHPGSLAVDLAPGFAGGFVGERPKLLFNPTNGRPAYPLLRPHIGFRPPFSPNGHSGAPWLGESGDAAARAAVDPYAGRADGLCPQGASLRRFNVVAITLPIRNTKKAVDPNGMIFVLAKNKQGVYGGTKPAEPLALRTNAGECDAVTLTSELTDAEAFTGFSKVNMHIHHVQFDTQASDGVITGMQFEQSVRPYKVEDPTLRAAAAAGATTLSLSSVAKFQPGVWIGVGLGTEGIEVRQIDSIDAAASTVTLTRPLGQAHAAGEWAGVEFVQYRWYPDVLLDNIFWHDHVDGIHGWGHGLVGQLLVEPAGSTYHDPKTGDQVDSGTIVDIHTSNALAPGLVDGSYREFVLWTIDDNPSSDSTLNLKAEPWADRLNAVEGSPDPSLLFSSYRHGDPITPLPRAYPKDPFVIRTINVGPSVDGLHVDGHRFFLENRYIDSAGKMEASPLDTFAYGISERFTLILEGGAGGPRGEPGDYLYMNSIGRRFRQGAWGLIRVLPGQVDNLQPLPGHPAPANAASLPSPNGGRPPAAAGAGNPCPAGAPTRSFDVRATDVAASGGGPVNAAFAVAGQTAGREPLVLHAAVGDCVTVRFTNNRPVRSSFHVAGGILRTDESSGVNAGFNPENTVASGGTRTYRYYVDSPKLESALISDFGGGNSAPVANPDGTTSYAVDIDPALDGVYGALEVAPKGATFTDPNTGAATDFGSQVDVHVPGTPGYRDFTLLFFDEDARIGQNHMPYPRDVDGPALINYGTNPRPDGAAATQGSTPTLRAYPGDPMRVHALVAPASEQLHSFNLGGLSWPIDPLIGQAEEVEARGIPPWGAVNAHVIGGAGGRNHTVGDFWYGDLRRPFVLAGMGGIQRVLSPEGCPIKGLDGHPCANAGDTTPPTVSVTAPAEGATVGATIDVTADASDNVAVAGVQFKVDGQNLGAEDTTAPYSVAWDTTKVLNGPHTLTAMARDAAGNTTGSAGVSVTVSNAQAAAVTPASLAFGDQQVGTTSAAQLVTVANSGTAPLTVSGAVIDATSPNAADFAVGTNGCATASPLAVGASCTIGVTFRPGATGPRSATLLVSTNAAGSPHAVPLSGNGVPAGVAAVSLSPATVDFANQALGSTSAAKNVVLTNSGTATLNVGAVSIVGLNAGDFSVPPGSCVGPLAASGVCSIPVSFAPSALGARSASLQVTSDAAGSPHAVGLSGTGVDGTAPTVAITAPAGGATVSATVDVTATASDNVGVAGVQFKADGVNIGLEDTAAPFTVPWNTTGVADGPHSLTAVARDAAGNTTPSAAVSVTVKNNVAPVFLLGDQAIEPSVDFNAAGLAEAFKTTAAASGTVTSLNVYVDAASTATTLAVGLYSDTAGHPGTRLTTGTLVGTVKGAWNSVSVPGASVNAGSAYWIALLGPSGGGTLRFRDRCCGGGQPAETSAQTTLTSLPATWATGQSFVDGPASAYGLSGAPAPADTTPPTVNVTAPGAGTTVSGTTTLSANASDNVGVAGVTFKVDGSNVGVEDTSAPYSVAWNSAGVANGSHTVTAVARDAAGNSTTSAGVAVTVSNGTAPALLFGDQTILPSADSNGAGSAEAFRVTATATGSVTTLKVYVDLPSLASRLVAGVYTNNAGHPGTLLTQGTLDFPVKGAWNTITVPAASITSGTSYWIALLSPAGGGTLAFRDRCCGGGAATETSLQSSLTGLPASWSTGQTFLDGPVSAYGTG